LKVLKRFKIGIVAVVALALSFVAPPTGAHAQSNPYTPAGVCNSEAPGSGYYVQRSHALNGARVYQLYNGTYNCVVTIKTASVGTPTFTSACIQVTGKGWNCNNGQFSHYAGAVWYDGRGKCVKYYGYHDFSNHESGWNNCG
jgi:hypothetical protein